MPMIQTDSQHYSDIADAIRAKNGTQNTYYPADMAGAISAIPIGGQGYTYYIKTTSTSGQDASLRVVLMKDNVVLSDTIYAYNNPLIFETWLVIGNIKIGYRLNNDTQWYLASNNGTIRNVDLSRNYTTGQSIDVWYYNVSRTFVLMDILS